METTLEPVLLGLVFVTIRMVLAVRVLFQSHRVWAVLAAMVLSMPVAPFIALDLDPWRIREAAMAGESVTLGDAARREVLIAAGVQRARAVAVSHSDTASAFQVLRHVQNLRPGLPVVVRTFADTDIDRLKAAGAAETKLVQG